ncbi:hypothetical protein [uncultured Flavobacterium sp.]|mgnify:FL=1|uniref:hypothetical protein n=1 Tax=uncultured Flavobacterium sp. TaxID=165435 RepID=UPI0025F12D2A|nr:hypothetical protein [uncultured Flavobacterium sp.]
MKKITLLLIGICFASCSNKNFQTVNNIVSIDTIKYVPPKITDYAFVIIPGDRIGMTKLEENVETLSKLGKPDFSDSAMGKSWMTWVSKDDKKNELNIYSTYKDSEMKEKVVRQIRITSPKFQTPSEISTGKTLQEIQKEFEGIKLVGKYIDEKTKNLVEIYDAKTSGIAFEFTQNKCVAIIVHTKGKKVTEEYITLHPNMEKF